MDTCELEFGLHHVHQMSTFPAKNFGAADVNNFKVGRKTTILGCSATLERGVRQPRSHDQTTPSPPRNKQAPEERNDLPHDPPLHMYVLV